MDKAILKDYRLYDMETNTFLDTVDLTLAEIAYMTVSVGGAGILGEIDTPVIGQVQSMTTSINFHTMDISQLGLMNGSKKLEARGVEQYIDVSTGEIKERGHRIVQTVSPKKYAPGTYAKASEMGSNFEGEVAYLKIEYDGKTVAEIDKYNYICTIDGVDVLEKTREHLGL